MDIRPEDFTRPHLAGPFDLADAKRTRLEALDEAERVARERPPEEAGCLYYAVRGERFLVPQAGVALEAQGIVPHYGGPGGVLPQVAGTRLEDVDAR